MDELYIDDDYFAPDEYTNAGIYIDWGRRVIYVPRQTPVLIQSTPTEVRQLDIDLFRLTLKDLEDNDDGMPFPNTHANNPPVDVGGVTLSRAISIINDFTVTFEDGQYTVQLTGANSNISQRVNRNQVSVETFNSAGLIDNNENLTVALNTQQEVLNNQLICELVRKLLTNRVNVSGDDAVTTIYDDDGATPLLIFDHADVRNRVPRP